MASDSDSEEDFVTYGTPLEPLDEDEPLRKPIPIQDQTVKDEKGRFKRFHGAFTGGFSAGYFNTVGTKEGWAPSTFLSSRKQKAEKQMARPEDFMDEEDLGEHGIAPREITTTDDFASGRRDQIRDKARAISSLTAPIPGDNVLEDLVAPARTSVGVELLKKMGWKEGQGVGPRMKRKPAKQKTDAGAKVYGLPPKGSEESEEEEDEYVPENVTFAPKDVTPIDFTPKDDLHGLGYRGLNPQQALMGGSGAGHLNLFTMDSDRARSLLGDCGPRNRRSGGVTGQAFGVGAMEEEDADIYHRDALSNYDAVLGGEEPGDGLFGWTAPQQYSRRKKASEKDAAYLGKILEGFTLAANSKDTKTIYPPPTLPRDYRPVHYFRPVLDLASVSPQVALALQASVGHMTQDSQPKGRHQLDSSQRGELLGESSLQGPTSVFDLLDSKDRERLVGMRRAAEGRPSTERTPEDRRAAIVAAGVAAAAARASSQHALASHSLPTATEQTLSVWSSPAARSAHTFKPFEGNAHKQARYDMYISKLKQGDKDPLECSLDPGMTEWERGRERDEFVRAAMLYKPSSSSLSNRFTSAKTEDDGNTVEVPRDQEGDVDDKQAAVKMKMFGKLTRDTFEWHPDKLLCKRFNIPHPYPGSGFVGLPKIKRDKFSVFNFLTLTDSNSAMGGRTEAPSQSVPTAQHGAPKPAEATKRSRWDMTTAASEGKDPLSEFLSVARSEASSLQQGPSGQEATAPTADPPAESKAEQQQKEEEEEEEEEESRPPMDLFKAIFASSSDEKSSSSSEGESEEEEEVGVEQAGPQTLVPPNTGTNPPAPPAPPTPTATPVQQEVKSSPGQSGSAAVPPRGHKPEEEEFGPRLPPPSYPWTERLSSSMSSAKEEKHKKKCKEKHKAKKEHKHKKDKKHKKKHKKHKHKGKQQQQQKKKNKKVEEEGGSSSSDGSADSGSDTDDGPGALSTEELLKRLKTLGGKKM
ncbi:hypothetical protein AAFF_G00269490 [Aldrovandia affinis]|uniref:G-patch domain-containing protein n=1 Tax=Aldrovandia affinis TaxID=143900 RepID=A0AAD7SSQ5_9TELE|nr:hypothetical protein AAFF_G00269490 [Aldrovandia affinis]